MFSLIRLIWVIWIFGFIVLALTATSSFTFSNEGGPERSKRWHSRLRMSLMWPVALMSADGRARPRRG